MAQSMVSLSSFMKTRKNTLRGNRDFIWLFELRRDSTNVSYYAQSVQDETFNSQPYTGKSIDFEPPSESFEGALRDFSIFIGDAEQTEAAYLEGDKYRNQRMVARLVNRASMSISSDQRKWRAIIKSARLDEDGVLFRCGGNDLRKTVVPRCTLKAQRCRHRFKNVIGCGYAGAEAACDLRFLTCRNVMSNQASFGGAPGMPRRVP